MFIRHNEHQMFSSLSIVPTYAPQIFTLERWWDSEYIQNFYFKKKIFTFQTIWVDFTKYYTHFLYLTLWCTFSFFVNNFQNSFSTFLMLNVRESSSFNGHTIREKINDICLSSQEVEIEIYQQIPIQREREIYTLLLLTHVNDCLLASQPQFSEDCCNFRHCLLMLVPSILQLHSS